MKRFVFGLAVLALLLGGVGQQGEATASLITYTNQAAFSAAAGPTTLQDFNYVAPLILGGPSASFFGTGFTGYSLTGNPNGDYVAFASGTQIGNIDGSQFLYWSERNPVTGIYDGDGGQGPTFTFIFSQAITAFAFDWKDTDGTDSYQITLNGQNFGSPPFAFSGTGSGFFGVVANGGETFTQVTFSQTQAGGIVDPFGLDNVRFAVATSVPEPASLTLASIAALCLGRAAWRRRKKARSC